jgi:hypothetical protein
VTIRLQASVQSLVFSCWPRPCLVRRAASILSSSGFISPLWRQSRDCRLSSSILKERMRPGGRRVAYTFCRSSSSCFCTGRGWHRPRAPSSQRRSPAQSRSRGAAPVRLGLDCDRLGHVREPVLFIDPANSVGAWPSGDQRWSALQHPILNDGAPHKQDQRDGGDKGRNP